MSVFEPFDHIARLEDIYERLDKSLELLMGHPFFALDVVHDILLIQQVIFTKIQEWRRDPCDDRPANAR